MLILKLYLLGTIISFLLMMVGDITGDTKNVGITNIPRSALLWPIYGWLVFTSYAKDSGDNK